MAFAIRRSGRAGREAASSGTKPMLAPRALPFQILAQAEAPRKAPQLPRFPPGYS